MEKDTILTTYVKLVFNSNEGTHIIKLYKLRIMSLIKVTKMQLVSNVLG
jgi:hypothetical protein